MQHLEKAVKQYLDDLDRADREPASVPEARVSHLKEKIATIKAEMRKLTQIKKELPQTEGQQVSLTDPDARSMNSAGKGTGTVGYNVQTAVDTKNHMIVAHEVTNCGHDRSQLTEMAKLAREACGSKTLTALADRGYFSGEQILRCGQGRDHTVSPEAADLEQQGRRAIRQAGLHLQRQARRVPMPRRRASDLALQHCGKRANDPQILVVRLPAMPYQSAVYAGRLPTHRALGA
jgi:hypothetical protein